MKTKYSPIEKYWIVKAVLHSLYYERDRIRDKIRIKENELKQIEAEL